MLSPNINRIHTTISANFAQCLIRLLIGCLILALMPVLVMANGKGQSNNRADKNAELRTKSDSSSGKTGSVITSDRPGKPDDHNSNGDDIPVRPPRQAKR